MMDNNANAPEAVKLVLDPEKEKMSVFGAKLVNLYVPAGFPQIVGETVEFLRKVGLHYAAKTEGFSASLVEQSGKEWEMGGIAWKSA